VTGKWRDPKEETAGQIEHAIEVTLKEPEWLKLHRMNSEALTIEQQASEAEDTEQRSHIESLRFQPKARVPLLWGNAVKKTNKLP
jgi:hypothetical protein